VLDKIILKKEYAKNNISQKKYLIVVKKGILLTKERKGKNRNRNRRKRTEREE
jgi:hypothetical protein